MNSRTLANVNNSMSERTLTDGFTLKKALLSVNTDYLWVVLLSSSSLVLLNKHFQLSAEAILASDYP